MTDWSRERCAEVYAELADMCAHRVNLCGGMPARDIPRQSVRMEACEIIAAVDARLLAGAAGKQTDRMRRILGAVFSPRHEIEANGNEHQ